MSPRYSSFSQRFWIKVEINNVDDCWPWLSATINGYGSLTKTDSEKVERGTTAHRIAWEICFGKVSKDLEVGHRCANRKCVNPMHLYLTTPQENKLEMNDRKNNINKYVYPEPLPRSVVEEIRKDAIADQIRHKLSNVDFVRAISNSKAYKIYQIINEVESVETFTEREEVETMLCGHSNRYVANSSDGTNFCVMCAFQAEHRQNAEIRRILE